MAEFKDFSQTSDSKNTILPHLSETDIQNDPHRDVEEKCIEIYRDNENVPDSENAKIMQEEVGEVEGIDQENDTLKGAEIDVLEEDNIQKDVQCDDDQNVTQIENAPDKVNTRNKQETISDFMELFKKNESMNEAEEEAVKRSNLQIDIESNIAQKVAETDTVPEIEDTRIMKADNKLLKITIDLQEIIISLLQHKLKLLDIKNRRFSNVLINAVDDVQNAVDNTLRNFLECSGTLQISELQNILETVESSKVVLEKNFVHDVEQILAETRISLSKYQEVFESSKAYLENFLQKADIILKTKTVSSDCQIKRSTLFSILEDITLSLTDYRLEAIKKAFDGFETIINAKKMSAPNLDRIDLLLNAFGKAEFVYWELKYLTGEVLRLDFAEV